MLSFEVGVCLFDRFDFLLCVCVEMFIWGEYMRVCRCIYNCIYFLYIRFSLGVVMIYVYMMDCV